MRAAYLCLLAAAVASAAYVTVDNDIFEKFGGGKQSFHSAGTQFHDAKQVNVNGKTRVKFIQFHEGLRVLNTGVVATASNDGFSDVDGTMVDIDVNDDTSIRHSLTMVDPMKAAKDYYLKLKKLEELDVDPDSEQIELVINPDSPNGHAKKVYLVSFFNQVPPSRPFFYVDPTSGDILDHWEGLDTGIVDGRGPGGNRKTGRYTYGSRGSDNYKGFKVTKSGNRCRMENNEVKTVNMNHGTRDVNNAFEYDCGGANENTFKQVNGAYSPMNDAHYFGKVLYDMYRDWANVKPLKFQLKIRVHYSSNYENAFWDGRALTFGDGLNYFYPLVDLNVVTHEAAHGFTEQNSGLIYRDMSGGMNEAYSDIAGEAAEQYMKGRVDWMVGYEITKGQNSALRFFNPPSKDGRSIDHTSSYYNGIDVHFSSGIFNFAFYKMVASGKWSVKQAFQAFTLANQIYWSSGSTFNQGACGVLKAARDLGYDQATVGTSFKDVGVNFNACSIKPPTQGCKDLAPKTVCDWFKSGNSCHASYPLTACRKTCRHC